MTTDDNGSNKFYSPDDSPPIYADQSTPGSGRLHYSPVCWFLRARLPCYISWKRIHFMSVKLSASETRTLFLWFFFAWCSIYQCMIIHPNHFTVALVITSDGCPKIWWAWFTSIWFGLIKVAWWIIMPVSWFNLGTILTPMKKPPLAILPILSNVKLKSRFLIVNYLKISRCS